MNRGGGEETAARGLVILEGEEWNWCSAPLEVHRTAGLAK